MIYLGEALTVMDRLITEGVVVDAVICDPPYGTTACKWDSIIPLTEMWLRVEKLVKPDGAIVLFGQQPFTSMLVSSNIGKFKYQWAWVKNNTTGHLNAKRKPMRLFEDILVFGTKPPYYPQGLIPFNKKVRRGHNGDNYGVSGKENIQTHTNYPTDILCFDYEKKKLHPTQKPVALLEYLVKTYTNEGETVLDFAAGSGTTGVACKNLNRNFIGIELDVQYFNIAKERINATN